MTEPFDLEAWMRRAANVRNDLDYTDTMPGAFFVIDYGEPSVAVYTHAWDGQRGDYERVGNPVFWGSPYGRATLEEAAAVAADAAEEALKAAGRWGE